MRSRCTGVAGISHKAYCIAYTDALTIGDIKAIEMGVIQALLTFIIGQKYHFTTKVIFANLRNNAVNTGKSYPLLPSLATLFVYRPPAACCDWPPEVTPRFCGSYRVSSL